MAEHPHIVIDCPPRADGDGFDINVQAEGFASHDELATTLLLLVERITGVRTDGYVRMVDECRRVAAREQVLLAEVADA